MKLKWMEKPTEITGELLDAIKSMERPGIIVAAYAQNDTWDVHVFVIYSQRSDGSNGYEVMMYHFPKEEKSQELFDDADLFCDAMTNGIDDSCEYITLQDAIAGINQD